MVLVTGKKRRISPITLILQSPLKEAESSIDACKRYALNAVILLFTVFSKSRNASALPLFMTAGCQFVTFHILVGQRHHRT